MTTLHNLKRFESGEPELKEAGYRALRATIVLAENSKALQELQEPKLERAIKRVRKENFDFERVPQRLLELIYGYFDNDFADKVTDEFKFVPRLGNIRNLGGREGHCELCGKGDSLEHRENRDKLCYEFKLENHAGGTDVWVGSTCILQHGLHVDGGQTAEEAERILKKAFNQHKLQWEIEAWRRDNPDHFEIPDQWERLQRYCRVRLYPDIFWTKAGLDAGEMLRKWYELAGANRDRKRDHFKGAARQYQTRGALTPGKDKAWTEAKQFLAIFDQLVPIFREIKDKHWYSRYSVSDVALDELDKQLKVVKRRKSYREAISLFVPIKPRRARRNSKK